MKTRSRGRGRRAGVGRGTFARTRGNLRGSPRSVTRIATGRRVWLTAQSIRLPSAFCFGPFACGTRLVIAQIARRGDADLEKLAGNGRFRPRLSKSRRLPGAPSRKADAPSPSGRRATLQQSRFRGVLGPSLRSTIRHSSRKGQVTQRLSEESSGAGWGNISDAAPGLARHTHSPVQFYTRCGSNMSLAGDEGRWHPGAPRPDAPDRLLTNLMVSPPISDRRGRASHHPGWGETPGTRSPSGQVKKPGPGAWVAGADEGGDDGKPRSPVRPQTGIGRVRTSEQPAILP
jgi:hypothetical protein